MMTEHASLSAKGMSVHQRLLAAYGEPIHTATDPVDELMLTILSQNTNDRLRDTAYQRLRQQFPTWDAVLAADVNDVAAAIQVAGLGQQKAASIKAALAAIRQERGALSLAFLRDLPIPEAKAWLTRLNGVGPKTAAIVLLFALEMPAFPVDTHVHRVTQRLGLIAANVSREKAHDILEALVPPDTYFAFHINLITHGRRVCQARRPRCAVCPLQDLCDWYSGQHGESRAPNAR